MTAGAGAGVEGGGGDAARRVAAGRAGAGAVRRAGLGFVSLGAVTVTSGSVSDTWPQAGPGEVSNGNAPTATAPKSLSTRLAYIKDKGAGGRYSRSWQSVQPWPEKKANGTRGIAKQPDGRSMRLHGGRQIASKKPRQIAALPHF